MGGGGGDRIPLDDPKTLPLKYMSAMKFSLISHIRV